jgi:hypothetical protein
MKIIAKFADVDSFTAAEAIRRTKDMLGDFSEVKAYPSTADPWDTIYFAIQQIITDEQLNLLFDEGPLYLKKLSKLRSLTIEKLTKELDEVITDNEYKAE